MKFGMSSKYLSLVRLPLLTSFDRFFLGFSEQRCATEAPSFPNIHAAIRQDLDPKMAYPNHVVPPRYTAVLQIRRNTSLATLSSLLRFPFDWEFVDGQTTRSPVQGVSSAYVTSPATFTPGQPDHEGFFTPVSGNIRGIWLRKRDEDEWEQERRETSIRTLSQFSLPDVAREDEDGTLGRDRLDIQCYEPEDAKAWIREVSPFEDPRVMLIRCYSASLLVPTKP
jgi:hypothetical protein